MSKIKKPQAGEWWSNSPGNIWYIVGVKLNGDVVAEDIDGKHICWIGCTFHKWTHLPDCTGFDWTPEPKKFRLWVQRNLLDGTRMSVVFASISEPDDDYEWSEVIPDGNGGFEIKDAE